MGMYLWIVMVLAKLIKILVLNFKMKQIKEWPVIEEICRLSICIVHDMVLNHLVVDFSLKIIIYFYYRSIQYKFPFNVSFYRFLRQSSSLYIACYIFFFMLQTFIWTINYSRVIVHGEKKITVGNVEHIYWRFYGNFYNLG